jgi:hypothetical protein
MEGEYIGWIIYRRNAENLIEFVGIYPTQQAAEKNVADMQEKLPGEWHVNSVPFQGWSHFEPGVAAEQPAVPATHRR